MNIRKAELNDCDTIAKFNCAMALETENKKLDYNTVLRGAKAVIKDQHKGFYLIAIQGEEIIGQLMVTPEWSDWRNMFFWWIQSVYIPPDHRRKGIYSKLYNHLKDKALTKKHIAGIRLYVEKNNTTAQTTYESLGMHDPGYKMYEIVLKK